MALDFYVNHERYSNSTVFYRTTGAPANRYYNVMIKLSDEVFPDADLYSLYNVQYSFNREPFRLFIPDDNGRFQTSRIIDTSVPCLCSFVVSVSVENTRVNYFDLSAKIIPYFPEIDFIAYPSLYINLSTSIAKEINATNYELSSRGVYFYGEGHTEVVYLSSNNNIRLNNEKILWYVGNNTRDIRVNPLSSMLNLSFSSIETKFGAISSLNTTTATSAIELNYCLSNTNYLHGPTSGEDEETSSKKVRLSINQGATQQLTITYPTTAYVDNYVGVLSSTGATEWNNMRSTNVPLSSWLLYRALSADAQLRGDGVNIVSIDPTKKTVTYSYNGKREANPNEYELKNVTYSWEQSAAGLEYVLYRDRPDPIPPQNSIYLNTTRIKDGVLLNNLNGVLLSSNTFQRRIEFQFYIIQNVPKPIDIVSSETYTFATSSVGILKALRAQQDFYSRPSYRKTLNDILTFQPQYTAIRINDVLLSTLSPLNQSLTLFYPATGHRSFNSASVAVSSKSDEAKTYPISIWATNSHVTTAGPIATYNDETGSLNYYPFFASSIGPDGGETGLSEEGLKLVDNPNYLNFKTLGSRFKSSIQLLTYPKSVISILENPFPSSNILLPLEYTSTPFWTYTSTKDIFGDAFTEKFRGTRWELQGSSPAGDWTIQTRFLSGVATYQFKLCYDEDTGNPILPTFKASAEYPTTITLTVSSYKDIYIDKYPNDNVRGGWKSKLVTSVNSVTATVDAFPINKIYTPNYYYTRNQDVPFTIISYPDYPLSIEELTLTSPSSKETIILNRINSTDSMKFDIVGVADIHVTGVLKNLITNSIHNVSFVYQDMLEITKNLDDSVQENSFHTEDTPLILPYAKPRVTPNEWITEDVVNNIIENFYQNINELISYSKLYSQKSKFYAYLAPEQKLTSMPGIPLPVKKAKPSYVWLDLDCSLDGVTDDFATWEKFTTGQTNTWEWQNCGKIQTPDPSALEKYCIKWTWRWRKKGASEVNVTWAETKENDSFAKKWRYEPCTIAPVVINCNRTRWFVSTIDFEEFPISSTIPINRCLIVDAEISKMTNQLIVAHPTEIQLFNRDKDSTYVASVRMADKIVGFQNIIGLTTNKQGKVIVLDNYLPRVCIYQADKNDFIQIAEWGKYGTVESNQGFNNPKDIYIDHEDCVWISDYGNFCIKRFNIIGKRLQTITHPKLNDNGPLSVCIDSSNNVHCLTNKNVIVFNLAGEYVFEYFFADNTEQVSKISASSNKHFIYISHKRGISKYFKTGDFAFHLMNNYICKDGSILEGYNSVSQDDYRNVFVTVGDKILQIADLQHVTEIKAPINPDLLWSINDLLIHKDEYVQPWVYLKAFHRLWDNIELLRTSLFYNDGTKCKNYVPAKHAKADLIIGQNEIVSNAVINRVVDQLWENFESMLKYFDPSCKN